MKLKCRAKQSPNCQDGMDCETIYGEDSMADDGTYDGESVVCDACYIAGGQPALPYPATREAVIRHVNREMGIE